jgi:prevent-host-death family protein
MKTVNAREVRSRMSELLDEAEHGTVIAITRRGRIVARLMPAEAGELPRLPDLGAFRAGIAVAGAPTSAFVERLRGEERS